jgi:hypothetical protein
VQVSAASRFTCARQRAGRVYCWGSNAEGQLGNGSPNAAANPSPILVPSLVETTWIGPATSTRAPCERRARSCVGGAGSKASSASGAHPMRRSRPLRRSRALVFRKPCGPVEIARARSPTTVARSVGERTNSDSSGTERKTAPSPPSRSPAFLS